jgi:glucan 1,3-beta-glucosidase
MRQVITKLTERHSADPTVWGVEPVNEPWQFIPIDWIKKFYWEAYNVVRAKVRHALCLLAHTARMHPP